MRSQITLLEREQDTRRRQHLLDQAELEPADQVLERINRIFRDIITGIELPYSTGRARVDPQTLLPLIDDQTFEQRGGGARSAVSIAYSLALLAYTLENELARLPALLTIDSPQKNFGANETDKALARRVYERFLDHMPDWRAARGGVFERPFQLIIVDNDRNAAIRQGVKYHQFSHDNGFIRGLADPHAELDPEPELFIDPGDPGVETP
jgi:hypothetical protein